MDRVRRGTQISEAVSWRRAGRRMLYSNEATKTMSLVTVDCTQSGV